MKFVLIGSGRIASNHIIAATNNNLEIAGVCDIVNEHMEELLRNHGLKNDNSIGRYTDYIKMLNEVKPDIAAIATDSGVHAKIALACIDRGIHVILEKPIALSLEDADEIISRANKMDVRVAVCHQNRFNIAVQELRHAIDEGRFGEMSHGSINVRWNRDSNYYSQATWRGTWAQDGGCLMNQCIHGIDLLRWLMGGEVYEVYGQTRQRFHDYIEAEDIGMAVIKFKSGAIATIEGTVNVYPQNLEETLYIFGEKGTVKLGGKSCNTIDVWRFADEVEKDKRKVGYIESTLNVYGNGHSSLYTDMLKAITEHRAPYVDAQDGREALEVVLAIYKSQKEGIPIKLPLIGFKSTEMAGSFDY